MTIESALREAIGCEERIRDQYREAAAAATTPDAKRFFSLLERDEDSHVRYLGHKLVQWKDQGIVDAVGLGSALPDTKRLEAAAAKAGANLSDPGAAAGRMLGGEEEAMRRALKAEEETTAFYRTLVADLPKEARPLFSRFLDIEEGHARIVRAELDLAERTGHWFDARVFDLED
ncbi:MAG: hypothetical protein JNG85_16300 [Spirochaetaceae bacterium]|nr:hypothetical protein [Spirochaetaceae bacterium]